MPNRHTEARKSTAEAQAGIAIAREKNPGVGAVKIGHWICIFDGRAFAAKRPAQRDDFAQI